MDRLTSRKLWLAIALVVFAVIGIVTGQLTWDQASQIIQKAVLGYIAAEGAADVVGRIKASDNAWTGAPAAAAKPKPDGVSGI